MQQEHCEEALEPDHEDVGHLIAKGGGHRERDVLVDEYHGHGDEGEDEAARHGVYPLENLLLDIVAILRRRCSFHFWMEITGRRTGLYMLRRRDTGAHLKQIPNPLLHRSDAGATEAVSTKHSTE